MHQSKKGGFTLIELLVVIAIIGVLSAVVLGSISSAKDKSDDAKRISDLRALSAAINMYYSDNGSYPVSAGTCSTGDWTDSVGGGNNFRNALVPKYISSLPLDPKNAQRSCAGPWNYYYGFGNTLGWTWGSCVLNTKLVLYSVGSPTSKVFQDGCNMGSSARINTIIFDK